MARFEGRAADQEDPAVRKADDAAGVFAQARVTVDDDRAERGRFSDPVVRPAISRADRRVCVVRRLRAGRVPSGIRSAASHVVPRNRTSRMTGAPGRSTSGRAPGGPASTLAPIEEHHAMLDRADQPVARPSADAVLRQAVLPLAEVAEPQLDGKVQHGVAAEHDREVDRRDVPRFAGKVRGSSGLKCFHSRSAAPVATNAAASDRFQAIPTAAAQTRRG